MIFVNIVTILIGISVTLFGFLIRNEKNLHLISINLEEIQEIGRAHV